MNVPDDLTMGTQDMRWPRPYHPWFVQMRARLRNERQPQSSTGWGVGPMNLTVEERLAIADILDAYAHLMALPAHRRARIVRHLQDDRKKHQSPEPPPDIDP